MQLLETLFPEKDWWSLKSELLFGSKDKWTDAEHQRRFFEELGSISFHFPCSFNEEKLGIKELDDWYSIKHSDIIQHGGGNLVRLYQHSHIKALTILYPKYNWRTQIPQVPKYSLI